MSDGPGKGGKRRPCLIPQWKYTLNYDLAHGHITREQYDKKIKGHEDGEQKNK